MDLHVVVSVWFQNRPTENINESHYTSVEDSVLVMNVEQLAKKLHASHNSWSNTFSFFTVSHLGGLSHLPCYCIKTSPTEEHKDGSFGLPSRSPHPCQHAGRHSV